MEKYSEPPREYGKKESPNPKPEEEITERDLEERTLETYLIKDSDLKWEP